MLDKKMTKTVEVSDLAPKFHEGFAYLQMDMQKHSFKNRRVLAGHRTLIIIIINANYFIF